MKPALLGVGHTFMGFHIQEPQLVLKVMKQEDSLQALAGGRDE